MSRLQMRNMAMPINFIATFLVSWHENDVQASIAPQPEGGSWYPSN